MSQPTHEQVIEALYERLRVAEAATLEARAHAVHWETCAKALRREVRKLSAECDTRRIHRDG